MLMTPEGVEGLVVAVKATYAWRRDGSLGPLSRGAARPPRRCLRRRPATHSGLVSAAELTLPKPRVDVLLEGELVPPARGRADRLHARGRAAGAEGGAGVRAAGRSCRARRSELVPSRPKAFSRMPIALGAELRRDGSREPSVFEPRNPVGCGVRKRVADLKGQPAPSFEDPRAPIAQAGVKATPVGLGPVAPHWLPRREWAGTYDEAWQKERFPLLPEDFDPPLPERGAARPAARRLPAGRAGAPRVPGGRGL